jgi:hypothetical protein
MGVRLTGRVGGLSAGNKSECKRRVRPGRVAEGEELAAIWHEQRQDLSSMRDAEAGRG